MEEVPLKDMTPESPDTDPTLIAEHLRPDTHVRGEEPICMKDHQLFTQNPTVPGLDPENMIGRTFLMPEAEDLSRQRAKIIERVIDHKKQHEDNKAHTLFKV